MEIGPSRYLYWVDGIMDIEQYADLNDWCLEQYGVFGPWFFSDNKVCFYEESDRLVFILRWS